MNHKHHAMYTRTARVVSLVSNAKLTEVPSKLGVNRQSLYKWVHV